MPTIKPGLTQQRCQLLGAHDNWQHKQGIRREQRKQAKLQHLIDQRGGNPGGTINTVLPKNTLALAILTVMATAATATATKSRTPSHRQQTFQPTPNPTRIAFYPTPLPSPNTVTKPPQRRRITELNPHAPTLTAVPSQTKSPAVLVSPLLTQHQQPLLSTTANALSVTPVPFTQTTIVSAGAIDISDTLRHLFFDYIHSTQKYLPTNNKDALDAYYRKAIADGTDHALFIHDQALQNYLEDKLDLVKTTSEHPGLSKNKQTIAPVIQQLLSALTDDIDFSIPGAQPTAPPLLGHSTPLPVSYFANTFRGLHPLSLEKARQHALSFITATLQKNYAWLDLSKAQSLAQALLTIMAPELTAFNEHDPGLHTIQYGSRQWGGLKIWLAVSQQLGLKSRTQSIEALTALGQAYTRHTIPTTEEIAKTLDLLHNRSERLSDGGGRSTRTGVDMIINEDSEHRQTSDHSRVVGYAGDLLTPDNTRSLPFQETILLQMAHAQAFINLAALTPQNQATTIKQYEQFIQAEFHREIRLAKAMAQMEKPMPLRTTIAENILRQAGYDPEQKIQRQTIALGYDGKTHTNWPKLVDVYKDYHISGLPVPISIDPIYAALLKRLPVLNDAFNQEFDTYQREMVRAITDLLELQLEQQIGRIPYDATITTLKVTLFFSPPPYQFHSNGDTPHLTSDNTFLSVQSDGAIQYFYITPDFQLHPLPSTVMTVQPWRVGLSQSQTSLEAWVAHHPSTFFKLDVHPELRTLAPEGVRANTQQTGKMPAMTQIIATQYVENKIDKLKDTAYQTGPLEEGQDLMRTTFIPFYSMVQNIRNRNYGEALFDGLMDMLGFMPAIGHAAKFGTTAAKMTSRVAAHVVTQATRMTSQFNMKAMARTGASIVVNAVGAEKTAVNAFFKQGGRFAWALLDGFSPVPLPGLGAHQLKTVTHRQLNEITKDLQLTHPGLSKHIETVAQQHLAVNNRKWVSAQLAIIHAKVQDRRTLYQSTQIINGREYVIAQLGDQPQTFFKKHRAQDGTSYVTQVNPLTDESYGLHYYLSSKNKIYLTDRTADSLLKEYRATPAIMQRYPGQKNSRGQTIVDLTMGAPANPTYQEGTFYIFLANEKYLMKKNERGMTFIIHPDKPEANILIEAADKKWRLPIDEVPSEFQEIKKGHSQSWTHPLTRENLIVTRLIDQDRVVALKRKGGSYREVNWATGESYHQRPLIFKQAEGQFSQASLAGGMKEGDDLPGTSKDVENKPV